MPPRPRQSEFLRPQDPTPPAADCWVPCALAMTTGKESQLHMEPMLVIEPDALEHWFTEEERFFRLMPGHDVEWHGEGVHVITSGKGAAGRTFEIGEHSEEEMRDRYTPDMYDEMHDEMHRVRAPPPRPPLAAAADLNSDCGFMRSTTILPSPPVRVCLVAYSRCLVACVRAGPGDVQYRDDHVRARARALALMPRVRSARS
jgi:hypothetical protein